MPIEYWRLLAAVYNFTAAKIDHPPLHKSILYTMHHSKTIYASALVSWQ